MIRIWSVLCILAVANVNPVAVLGQRADTTLFGGSVIAEFDDPVSLAVDPNGAIYVVDASTSTISRFWQLGEEPSVFGGPGSGDYEFDSPRDIDVSGELIWLVADAGNGRIKRFSSEFLHLGSMPVDPSSFTVSQSAGRGGFREEAGDPLRYSGGQPIAVAANMSGETFAIDANSGVVIKWNASRRIEHVFGGPGTLRGALIDPVAIAVDNAGSVFVADRAQASVLVYDRFGTYVRRIADGLAEGLVGLTVSGERLFVVMEDRLSVYSLRGDIIQSYPASFGEPLRDVSVAEQALLVLTETRLISVPLQQNRTDLRLGH